MVNKWILLNNEIMKKDAEGNLSLEKDKEALKSYFLDNVNKKTQFFYSLKEKLDYLIESNYWIDFYELYTYQEIKNVFKLVYGKKFRFKSFMAASKFYTGYALMDDTRTNYLERYEDRIVATALFLADGDYELALAYAEMMINQEYQPATPTFLNAGKARAGELVSCFLDEFGDDLPTIGYNQDSAMFLSSIGGGVAFNLSKLRARGEAIKGVDGRASGVLPIMKILEDTFSYANQLGQRDGSGAVYLNIFHNDIEEFLDCKKINADEKSRIKTLSIGVIIPDYFMQLAKEDKPYYVFGPHSVYKKYGVILDDINMEEWYSKLISDPDILKKKLNARHMLVKIAQIQKESGYPYIMYKDNANQHHALNNLGSVNFSNLCTEIMQVSEPSSIQYRGSGEASEYGLGISCNLGSLNIATVMENKSLEQTVRLATISLSTVSDKTDIQQVPSISKANDLFHSIGLGAMNLHGYLAKNHILYGSPESIEFVDKFFEAVNFYSIKTSMELAKKSKPFWGFEGSKYHTGEYFDLYTERQISDLNFKHPKVKDLFKEIQLPTLEDWKSLKEEVKKHGIRNAYRLAIAPNQSTGYIMNSTPSIMPISDPVEVREYGNSTTYYPMPYMTNENKFFFQSAYDIDQYKVLDLVATAQKHIDQGISCILHTKSEHNTRDLAKYFIYAHKVGLKSLYYTRTRKSNINDCISCSA